MLGMHSILKQTVFDLGVVEKTQGNSAREALYTAVNTLFCDNDDDEYKMAYTGQQEIIRQYFDAKNNKPHLPLPDPAKPGPWQ